MNVLFVTFDQYRLVHRCSRHRLPQGQSTRHDVADLDVSAGRPGFGGDTATNALVGELAGPGPYGGGISGINGSLTSLAAEQNN